MLPLTPTGPDEIAWKAIHEILGSVGVPASLRNDLRMHLTGDFDGLLLYGSWGRGDPDENSDLDILVLNFSGSLPKDTGKISLSVRNSGDLGSLNRTLFGYHLARDGIVLFDPTHSLRQALGEISPPRKGHVIDRIRSLTPTLDVDADDTERYLASLTKVARYLLRSTLYAQSLDRGEPCFSVKEIAAAMNDPELAFQLSSHPEVHPAPSHAVLEELKEKLAELIGPLEHNPHGTLHGLIEGAWDEDQELSNFATLALSEKRDDLPYDELPKVTL